MLGTPVLPPPPRAIVEPRDAPGTTSVFAQGAPTGSTAFDNGSPIELGVKLRVDQLGTVEGVWFYKAALDTSPWHPVRLWLYPAGTLLGSADSSGESASGWQYVPLAAPVDVAPGVTYVASFTTRWYAATPSYFGTAVVGPDLTALADGADGGNGVFNGAAGQMPNSSFNATNYWLDAAFKVAGGADTTAPVISAVWPQPAGDTSKRITWRTNEPADSQVEYGPTLAYGTLTPLDPALVVEHGVVLLDLTPGQLYHYRVRSRDAAGNLALSANYTVQAPAAGFDAVAPLRYLEALCAAIPGVQYAQIGAPLARPWAVMVAVTMGGFAVAPRVVGALAERVQRYYVAVWYRVLGAEADAEQQLGAVVNRIVEALYDDMTLGETCRSIREIDGTAADLADYAQQAGQEYRVYPLVVHVAQRRRFDPAQ